MTVDAHHHFWRYTPEEFGWIADAALRRDFGPAELAETIRARVDRVVSVEARQCVAETEQLLALARKHGFIAGVTGWLPIADEAAFPALLERFVDEPKLKALRHVVQDELDDAFILREDFNRGVARLAETPLAYEILVFQRQLGNAIRFADRHPNLRLVLDHMGKPLAASRGKGASDALPNPEWVRLVCEMAKRENVWCKVSGLVTEVGRVDFRPYVETVLGAFGPKRVMWGSDWPVCTADLAYADWLAACRRLLPEECLGEVAAAFYRL
ncbi:MAG: amidohydrolase family protein [Kiritimatiellia bacterium]